MDSSNRRASIETTERNWQEALHFAIVIGAWVQILWFFPGVIYSDSFDQYSQALSGNFSDWHPPIMAWFWRIQILLLGTGSLFYAFHILGYWTAIYLVLRRWGHKWWACFVGLSLGFAPFILPLLAVVWKDISLAIAAMLGCAIILDARLNAKRLDFFKAFIVTALFLYASFVRTNGPLLTAPLILLALGKWNRLSFWQPAGAMSIAAGLIVISPFVNNVLLGAKPSGSIISLQIFDLAGISHFAGTNLVPGSWTIEQSDRIVGSCYDPKEWDVFAWGKCKFVLDNVDRSQISHAWLIEIASHPAAYLIHRFEHFNSMMRFIGNYDALRYYVNVAPGYESDDPKIPAPAFSALSAWFESHPRLIWNMPYFWFALALGLFILTSKLEDKLMQASNAISAAALFYLIGYLPFGVASDFRYAIPPVLLICLAGLAVAPTCGPFARYSRWQQRILFIPVLVIFIGFIF